MRDLKHDGHHVYYEYNMNMHEAKRQATGKCDVTVSSWKLDEYSITVPSKLHDIKQRSFLENTPLLLPRVLHMIKFVVMSIYNKSFSHDR